MAAKGFWELKPRRYLERNTSSEDGWASGKEKVTEPCFRFGSHFINCICIILGDFGQRFITVYKQVVGILKGKIILFV